MAMRTGIGMVDFGIRTLKIDFEPRFFRQAEGRSQADIIRRKTEQASDQSPVGTMALYVLANEP